MDCTNCKYSGRPSYKSPCSECLTRQIVKTGRRIIDYTEVRNAFDEQFKKTRELILSGETHLDNLAEGFTEADRVIRSMPIVDAVPVVHARWIVNISFNNGERIIATCSNCKDRGEVRTDRNEWGIWHIDSPYCPNCGAKMDGDGNG